MAQFMDNPQFQGYFKSTHEEGALSAKTKELMHLAVVLALHCEP